jgi:hypothetical protein
MGRKYGNPEGKNMPPGMQIYDDEQFSMREFGRWTIHGAEPTGPEPS